MGKAPASSIPHTDAFKTFPEFSKLTLADRAKYESLIRQYPPIDDISFTSLIKWWNALDSGTVSLLNGNLVISYWMPGLEEYSGLSLVGTEQVDESICEIFDYQKRQGEPPRLVHVPEFVLAHVKFPDMFDFKPYAGYDEYILKLDDFFPVSHTAEHMQKRVKKFMELTADQEVSVRQIDLMDEANVGLLLDRARSWPDKGTINEIVRHSDDALRLALQEADALGTENLCLFVGQEIQAFIIYTKPPSDHRFVIFSHAKIAYDIPYTYEYMVYAFSRWLVGHGITHVNLTNDLGLPNLRRIKLALGPAGYFRKYTVEPIQQRADARPGVHRER